MSNVFGQKVSHTRYMAEQNEETAFDLAFRERVKALRIKRGWSAEKMATVLGVPAERYRKYEYRTNLPHYLIGRFAAATGESVEFVLTGLRETSMARPQAQGKSKLRA